ncbi:MAG: hypothetical protein Q8M23_06380 [Bacteroidales bacterium]|nr:hypothetical protein [Bacteroidales bacterium]
MKKESFEAGIVYHVYNRGNNYENLFREDRNYTYFLSLLTKHLIPVADIYAYCLLKNHFHLLIRVKDFHLLSEKHNQKPYLAFSNLFNAYAKAINKAYHRSGSLFKEHLQRKRIIDNEYLVALVSYIHMNPVKHGFTDDFESYPYSSYREYLSDKPSIVSLDYMLAMFDDINNFKAYHQHKKQMLLELPDEYEDKNPTQT